MTLFCFTDTETRSRTDISAGNDRYTRDAQVTIVTYKIARKTGATWDAQPTRLWQPWQEPAIPTDYQAAVNEPEVIFVAHNAIFDRQVLKRSLKITVPVRRWRCTRAQAYSHGLPGALETLGKVLGLPQDYQKLVEDGKLIHTFCEPQAATDRFIEPWELPVEWERFCNYAVRDTDALFEIYKRLAEVNFRGINLASYHLDQLSNERGFGFHRRLATAAVDFLADAKVSSDARMAKATGGAVGAATQRNKLLDFLQRKYGLEISNLRAAEVRDWLESDDLQPEVRFLLEQRLEANKSASSKYKRGLALVGPGDRLRNCIQFNGAGRTGRHAGRGYQPHNAARPVLTIRTDEGKMELHPVKASYIDNVIIPGIYNKKALTHELVYGGPNEACALAVRHAITAAPGCTLVVADFKNIESVLTAWHAGEAVELAAFEHAFDDPKDKSRDVYRLQWSSMFGIPLSEVGETERQGGKVVKLAFGFGGGVGALVTMAAAYQLELEPLADLVLPRATPEQLAKAHKAWRRAFLTNNDFDLDPHVYKACDILKQVYRTTNTAIDRMRRDVDRAVKNAVKAPNKAVYNVARCKIWSTGETLMIELPSGRRLLYIQPRIIEERQEDPDSTGKPWITETVTYMTARGKQWRRERAWGGLFVENIIQASANDVLRAAMVRVHRDTFAVPAIKAYLMTLPEDARTAISLHVHDEICLDVPVGSYTKERLIEVACQLEPWMQGLPMAADGWEFPVYGKR